MFGVQEAGTTAEDVGKLLVRNLTRIREGTFARAREPIPDDEYSRQELVSILREGWLPYYECHKCGWYGSCPHPIPHVANPDRAQDIQCGVAVAVLDNCLRAWWHQLHGFSVEDLQHFVDALYHLVQYTLDSHLGVGTLVANWNPDWWGPEMAASMTATPLYLRADLNGLARALGQVPFDFHRFQIVFVEGEAEKAFLEVLSNHRLLSHADRIEVIGGKGGATPERIPVGLLHGQGYTVSLQLDADGSKKKSYRELRRRVEEMGGSVFIFEQDFESAFPPPLLAAGLEAIDVDVDEGWLTRHLGQQSGGVVPAVEQKYGVRIRKPDLAVRLAELYEYNWGQLLRDWPENEIVRWVQFLITGQETTSES